MVPSHLKCWVQHIVYDETVAWAQHPPAPNYSYKNIDLGGKKSYFWPLQLFEALSSTWINLVKFPAPTLPFFPLSTDRKKDVKKSLCLALG